jgi:hypothetical protein
MEMSDIEVPVSNQPNELARSKHVLPRPAQAAPEGDPVDANTRRDQPRVDRCLRGPGDLSSPAMPGEAERKLEHMLRHSAIGRLECDQHTSHAVKVVTLLDRRPDPTEDPRAKQLTDGRSRVA